MHALKKKSMVRGLLNNEHFIFEHKDVEVGIIGTLVGIMLMFLLRLARSHTLVATLPPLFTIVFSE
jgi:hypothetical protein